LPEKFTYKLIGITLFRIMNQSTRAQIRCTPDNNSISSSE